MSIFKSYYLFAKSGISQLSGNHERAQKEYDAAIEAICQPPFYSLFKSGCDDFDPFNPYD